MVSTIERAFTEKFCRLTNGLLQVYYSILYLLVFILKVDSYFALLMRLCLMRKRAHLTGKILLGVRSSEIGMSSNIVPITVQLASSDWFFRHWEVFHF